MKNITPAEILRMCLKKTGMSQRQLAHASGVSEVTLSRISRGHSPGSLGTLQTLHAFYDQLPPDPQEEVQNG